MRRVIGLGGIFFRSSDPKKLYAWYDRHLGLKEHNVGAGVMFPWRRSEDPSSESFTSLAIFPPDTKYFGPTTAQFMLNYQVEDLDALLAALRDEGVTIDPKREDCEYGRFAWITDPEGNRIELWQPPKEK
jgi:catechol 2,3-dioxygenase-like lactoylglutathione lyase family enzyme